MPFIETSTGVTLHYQESGSGRPVVFLHGWAMSGRVWRFQNPLEDNFRLIFLDQRGHGQSTTAASYSIDDYAADVAATFDQLALEDAVLVGWSLGVQVALQAFPFVRERLAGLVLVGGTARFTTTDDYPHGKPPVDVKGLGLKLRRDYQKTMGDFFKGMFAEGEMDQAQYQRIVHEIVMGGHSPDTVAAKESLNLLSTVDQRDRLAQVDRPALLVHGELDTICPASASAYMAERMPMARLEVVTGCGHAPFMTQPEGFNAVVKNFIDGLQQ
ncbi:o-methylpimelyl-ACP methylesterase [Geoanaerobacter pelophilus]|uniref:O-methylpimelyl-ACP methylesterase n=1 Tax=Geoanaerobacter pelophilus TaxID=60036 RepID=A0ABQ0MPS2_9BACT|nr:alpha/beta fold hydrolase [Geoanaerobacter pelophilus]GAW69065.1 o-methylpimelyl-ACP methylesterase [Geoanaerobacter pelophilus]